MAKKRGKAVRRQSRSPARSMSLKQDQLRPFKLADVLVLIAIAFTLISAVLLIMFPEAAVEQSMNKYGYTTTAATWQLLGVSWLFLALFAYIANRVVRSSMSRANMWVLLIIGILLLVTSIGLPTIAAAILIIISSITYLWKSRK